MKNHKKRLDGIEAAQTVIPKGKKVKTTNDLVGIVSTVGSISMTTKSAKTKVVDIIDYNPTNKKYQKVADLPLGMQDEFVDVEGGFVRKEVKIINDLVHKEAYENYLKGNTKSTAPGGVLMEKAEEYLKKRDLLLEYFTIAYDKKSDFYKKNQYNYRIYYNIYLPYIEKGWIHPNSVTLIKEMIEEFKNDRAFMKETLKYIPDIFQYYPDEYKNDLEIAMMAVIGDSGNYEFISPKLKLENKEVFKIYNSKK
ncbi:DUF4116 domain-containing protein [Candidatus Gracilibacteria bacterium]|nr:DUF4116 domain-containing protein [Candidatus Gracilibacteria bacterium]